MANPFFGGFDTGDNTGGTSVANVTYSSTIVHSPFGGYSLRCTPTGLNSARRYERGFSSSTGEVANFSDALKFRFWMYVAAAPASQDEEIFTAESAGNDLSIRIDSNRKLSVWQETTQYGETGATVLALDTWYKIELDATNGAWELRINGVQELAGQDAVVNPITMIAFGKATNRHGQGYDIYFDDWAADSDDWPPADGVCALLVPEGPGTYQTWLRGGADSGSNWGQVDDVPPNGDTDYLLGPLNINDAETEAFTTVTSDAIHGLYGIVADKNNANSPTYARRLRSGTTDSDTTGTTAGVGAYGTHWSAGVYAVDPDTSLPWTQEALDAVEFGVVELETGQAARITFMGIVVHVDAPATSHPRPGNMGLSASNPFFSLM